MDAYHIYTNINKHSTESDVSLLSLFDISDHLPVFLILNNMKLATQTKIKFIRCMKNFNLDECLIDLKLQLKGGNFESLQSSFNDDVQLLSATFKSIIDKHAPLRTMSRKELRLNKKPWITKGILISIKTKNKLFKKFVKNSNQMSKANYKKYLNKLTQVKNFSKRLYYEHVIKSTRNDSSKTWKIINKIIDSKNSSHKFKLPSINSIDGQNYNTSSDVFLNKLCDFLPMLVLAYVVIIKQQLLK